MGRYTYLQSQVGKDKEAMEEEYQKALEVIFAYGYECCVFKHNICGDCSDVLEGMPDSADLLPPEFFVNPWCPPIQEAFEATTTEVPLSKATKEPVTPRPERVYGMCNRMCTKGFLNYFSAIIEFLKVVLRVTL